MKRILIAHPDEQVRDSLLHLLSQKGYKIQTVWTGEVALKHAWELPFDLIILEHHLPQLSGLEILLYVRKIRPELKIILLTDQEIRDKKPNFLENHYLFVKTPVSTKAVAKLAVELLEKK